MGTSHKAGNFRVVEINCRKSKKSQKVIRYDSKKALNELLLAPLFDKFFYFKIYSWLLLLPVTKL